ncbi:Mitochondrial matrix iron chaperone, partial [Coemansia sp. S85]
RLLATQFKMSSLSDSVYYEKSSEALENLTESLEDIGDQMEIDDYDIEYSSGVLTLKLGARGTYVINKQPPNKQIWISSPVSGPERYDYDLERGAWFCRQKDEKELDPATGDVGETPAGTTAAKPGYGKLVGENIGFNFMPGVRDSSLNELVRRIMHRNCDAILKISTPCDPGCCTLASKIAEDLEARLTAVALDKKGKNDPLDEWAMDVLAWAGVARDFDDRVRAEIMMAAKTKELFFNQHNRRFALGLTASSCTIRAYVFGKGDIWASAKMDIASAEGRLTFISLLVDWSLCPVDRLGFDPSIRY